jgi:two-component system response regulator WspF
MRIGIVNDLALARKALQTLVQSVPGYSVAWQAADGAEAVRRAREDRPDVVLMDLVMPVLDGVQATRQIMAGSPCPILLVTSSISGNFSLVCEAMSHGGLDAVDMPVLGPCGKLQGGEALLSRLARLDRGRQAVPAAPARADSPSPLRGGGWGVGSSSAPALPPLLAIGASTGGPEAVARILQALPASFPAAVVVVQHIAADFAPNLVVWLQGRCALPVDLARDGARPEAGSVAVAGTDDHLTLRTDRRFLYTREPADYPFRPSVNVFFESAAACWPWPGVAVLLTGMGSDGARGLAALRGLGWLTVAQDEQSSVVYGMPRAAVEMGAASRILPLGEIPSVILGQFAGK